MMAMFGDRIGAEFCSAVQAITGAAHGFDQAVMSRRLQRLAQATDMHVDCALFDEHVIAHTWSSNCMRL